MSFVAEIKRTDANFYCNMGKFFGSRQVAKEVGINIYDDSNKRWFVYFENDVIVGFASLKNNLVSDCYVIPEKRNNGIFTYILNFLIQSSYGKLNANCTQASKKVFNNLGFTEVRKSKNFTYMELNRA